jgi:hypothetical protein
LVVVFAVWEPILPTDWSAPGASVRERLNDPRVQQFWDTGHIVAAAIKKAESKLHPDCCDNKGFLWDLTAAYSPGSRWRDSLPEPILLNGPVIRTIDSLDMIVAKAK